MIVPWYVSTLLHDIIISPVEMGGILWFSHRYTAMSAAGSADTITIKNPYGIASIFM